MFVADLFEDKIQKTVVIMPGGFHPFHAGHLALYKAAQQAFPGADVWVAATNDTSERPFPFEIKQKLAQVAGVPANRFVQVKSPFSAQEITDQYDPNTTAVIFVRSEKDRGQAPMPAKIDPATGKLPLVTRGPRKGLPVSDYLQYYTGPKNLEPKSDHIYIAYLPTIKFKAGNSAVTSASEIRALWPKADQDQKLEIVKSLYPNIANDLRTPFGVVNLLDQAMGTPQVAEASDSIAPETVQLLKRARVAHPMAKSDEEALALYIADKEQSDFNRLDKENDQEEEMISQLMKIDTDIQSKIKHLQTQLNQVKEDASGVIASKKQAKDPRYSMSLTQDVRPGQVEKNLRAFKLAETMSDSITALQHQLINNAKDDIEYWTAEFNKATDHDLKASYKNKITKLKEKLKTLQGLR